MSPLSIYLALLAVVIANICLWRFIMPWYVTHRLTGFQNELMDRHYQEVETLYRRMRGWRHDYHNHIQVLKAYMTFRQYEQVEEYLNRLGDDLTSVDTMLKTGNVMMDAILNSKLTLIKGKNIRVDATAMVPSNIGISEIDLAVLVGNLLDNAMEACMHMQNQEERFIRIYIDIMKKQLYISVTNSMEGEPKREGFRFYSTKEGSHGFGILRIDSIVNKYDGYLNRQMEEGVFATEVLLPLVAGHTIQEK